MLHCVYKAYLFGLFEGETPITKRWANGKETPNVVSISVYNQPQCHRSRYKSRYKSENRINPIASLFNELKGFIFKIVPSIVLVLIVFDSIVLKSPILYILITLMNWSTGTVLVDTSCIACGRNFHAQCFLKNQSE